MNNEAIDRIIKAIKEGAYGDFAIHNGSIPTSMAIEILEIFKEPEEKKEPLIKYEDGKFIFFGEEITESDWNKIKNVIYNPKPIFSRKPDYHTMNEGIHKDPIREVYEKWKDVIHWWKDVKAVADMWNAIKQYCEDK